MPFCFYRSVRLGTSDNIAQRVEPVNTFLKKFCFFERFSFHYSISPDLRGFLLGLRMPPKPLSPVRCQGGCDRMDQERGQSGTPPLILLSASKPQKSRALPRSKKALLFFLPPRKHCVASARRVEEVFACDGFDVQAVAAAQQRERAVAHRACILVQVVAEDHALAIRA